MQARGEASLFSVLLIPTGNDLFTYIKETPETIGVIHPRPA